MFGSTRDPRPGAGPPRPSAIRRAAGLPPAPGFLETPGPPSYSSNPEIKKLILFGVGLLFCLIVTLVLAPKPAPDTAAQASQAAPKAEETAEERHQRLLTMFDGALSKVGDGSDFDESRSYLDLVRGVSRFSAADFHERANDWFDWQKAVAEPALVRGRFVKVRGLIARLDTVKLRTPAGDVTDVWRCYLIDADGTEKTVIDMVGKPPLTESNLRRDVVDVEGIFFRLVGFDAERSDKSGRTVHNEIPYLIGRSLSLYIEPPRGPQGTARVLLLVGLVLTAVVVAVILARQRTEVRRHPALLNKPGVGIREMFEMRRREANAKKPPGASPT